MKRTDIIKTFLLLAVLYVTTACNESYPGIDYDYSNENIMHNEDEALKRTPIMIFANQQNFITITNTTKGTGPFSSADATVLENKLDNATFYIYAFRNGTYSGGPSEFQNPTDFRQYHYATNASTGMGKDEDHIHCLLDGRDYWEGAKAGLRYGGVGSLIFKDSSGENTINEFDQDFLDEGDEKFYYSSAYPTVPYDFFGYYVDDIDMSKHHRDQDSVWFDIELDGLQDLLCGYAPRITENLLKDEYKNIYDILPRTEINNICNYGGYCTHAAQLGIHPHIKMKHQLSQLEFLAYPANKTANEIKITKIEIYSQTTGRLVVASKNLEGIGFYPYGEQKPLVLHDYSDGKTTPSEMVPIPLTYDASYKPQEWLKQTPVKLGGSILLSPQEQYTMKLYATQTIQDTYTGQTRMKPYSSEYLLKAPVKDDNKNSDGTFSFQPGLSYTIRIAVFGLEKIEVYTEIMEWVNGGEIDINDDDDFAF